MGKKSIHTSQPGDKKFVSKTNTCEQKCIGVTLKLMSCYIIGNHYGKATN